MIFISGFTLLEILIGMTIFFAAATSGLMAYQNAISSTRKAEQVLYMLRYVETIQQEIRHQLQLVTEKPFPQNGEGKFVDVVYRWSAQRIEHKTPAQEIDPDSGLTNNFKPRFALINVELKLEVQSAERVFNYQELIWSPTTEQQASP